MPSAHEQAFAKFQAINGQHKVARIRTAYQTALLAILQGGDRGATAATLAKIATGLQQICADTPLAPLWQAFSEFVTSPSYQRGGLESEVVKLLRRVDVNMKNLARDGELALRTPADMDLVQLLLDAAQDRAHSSDIPQAPGQAGVPDILHHTPTTFAQQALASEVEPQETDNEVAEFFVEEVAEVLAGIDEWLPQWAQALDVAEPVAELGSAFHTLKASARMAHAEEIGQLAWGVENMLNRVMDATVTANHHFVTVVTQARELIPDLVDSFDANRPADPDAIATIIEQADVLASGGEPMMQPASAAPAEEISAPAPPAPATEVIAADSEPLLDDADSNWLHEQLDDDSAQANPATEQVGSALLDELVNLADEHTILQVQIAQEMADLTASLAAMEAASERLREQLRQLEVAADPQALSPDEHRDRLQDENFDAPELDRDTRLQQLAKNLSETASSMADLQDTLASKARAAQTLLLQQAQINTALQEGFRRTPKAPFSQ